MSLRVGILGALLLSYMQPAWADDAKQADPDQYSKVEKASSTYIINDDATFTENEEVALTVLDKRAIEDIQTQSVTYSTSIQKADVLEAYTRKADGRRIDVPKSNYQVETNTGREKDSPIFSDQTTLSIVFPDVQVGDTIVYAYRLTATEPLFPKHFSVQEAFPTNYEFDDLHIKIDAPASLWTQYKAWGLTEVPSTAAPGRKVVEWTYSNPHPSKSKRFNYSVYNPEEAPGFEYSTFHNNEEIAQAYGERARPKASVTPQIQALADKIAADAKTPRETAQALYDWVAQNINYAGNCIGLGAVVPHDTSFIVDNHMGDCKDHATLLQALLAAKGIESTQVLINAGSSYELPTIPTVSMVNHVINYIPSLSLYADSTSNATPFGMLPYSDQGKPVLHVDGYKDNTFTPSVAVGSNVQRMKTKIRIEDDGSFNGDVDVSLKGEFAVAARSRMRYLTQEAQTDFIKNTFKKGGYIASGTFDKEDPKPLRDTYHFSAKLNVANYFQYPGTGAFVITPIMYNEAPVGSFIYSQLQIDEEAKRTTCGNGSSVEDFEYTLPKKMKVVSIPSNTKIATDFASYEATYKLKGNVLTVHRELNDKTKDRVCDLAYQQKYRDFALKVRNNLSSQVLYK